MTESMPRILVAGTHSGVGKTSVVLGLTAALAHRGLVVAPFKVGPDYVDPAFHARAAGRLSRNLDGWLLPPDELARTLRHGAAVADLALVEGMMGLYDGRSPTTDEGSSAAVARALGLPVLLVIDASAVARSAAAMVLGFQRLDERVPLVGVVANGVGSAGHLGLVRASVEAQTGLPVVGALPRDPAVALPERHLGLVLPDEVDGLASAIGRLGGLVGEWFDLDQVLRLAAAAPPPPEPRPLPRPRPSAPPVRVAVARDEAFAFYYPENLEILAALGAEVVPFSPLRDAALPPGTAGVYLGGGYPELHAGALAANRPLLAALRAADVAGTPIYAECGGLMYLTRGLRGAEGVHYWVGLVPTWTTMPAAPGRVGYVAGRVAAATALGQPGTALRGHVFHRSTVDPPLPAASAAYRLTEPGDAPEGFAHGNLVASYVHLHFGAVPELAASWLETCRGWASGR